MKNFYTNHISWTETKYNKSMDFNIDVAVHPFNNGIIVINTPGAEGNIDGYNSKYIKLANYLVQQKVGAVIRIPNPHTFGFGWEISLRNTINYALKNSKQISGVDHPNIYLMGFSAGATASALLAWEYPEVKKLLLFEPTLMIITDENHHNLKKFTKELTIVAGDNESAIGDKCKVFLNLMSNASKQEFFSIDKCDHQFRGEKNGKIISQAPIYAFTENKTDFLNSSNGVKLYD